MPAERTTLEGRNIAVILPGSAWLGILTSHVEWVVTTPPECIESGDKERIARQLRLLLAAVVEGASPTLDALVTETRELVDAACESLGHVADNEDTRLAAQRVIRDETLRSLIQKLALAAGYSTPPRAP